MSNLPHSFSGQDFSIWAYVPIVKQAGANTPAEADVLKTEDQIVLFGNLQTITTSLASSLSPVQCVGTDAIVGLTSGSKTFAGTMVFSVLDKDPLNEFILPYVSRNRKKGHEFFTIDQLPEFNVVIQGSNEYLVDNFRTSTPTSKTDIYKLIVGIRLLTHGETISIDDFFTEQTYQYQARYVSPWNTGTPNSATLTLNALESPDPDMSSDDYVTNDLTNATRSLDVIQAMLSRSVTA